MMFTTRALIALVALPYAAAQSCASSSGCDFEPFYPVKCGDNFECGYENQCLADSAGYSEDDCCTAPQPSACPGVIEPVVCGSKSCPYDNSCLAELSGYSSSQCSPAPPTCGTSTGSCSGEPSNPQKCGAGYTCLYPNLCEAEANGYTKDDCCQDTQTSGACSSENDPFSCGNPVGKQCPYSNACQAEAAGYKPDTQCCPGVPDGIACTSAAEPPLACGSIPCLYTSKCTAEAAGFSASSECCPQAVGACTSEIDSYTCGANDCAYTSLSCAALAGWSDADCCKQPNEVSTCSSEFAPVTCAKAGCVYDNCCVAELAGFDCASCVAGGNVQAAGDSGASAASMLLGATVAALGVAAEL